MRLTGLVVGAALSMLAWSVPTHAQTLSTAPLKIIVPAAPGSPPDLVPRILQEGLAGRLGVPVIVENRPGAFGSIGLTQLARSNADGQTIAVMSATFLAAPGLVPGLPLDIGRDLAAVAMLVATPSLLFVPASSPDRSVAELIGRAKQNPGLVRFASGGIGSPPHWRAVAFARDAGIQLAHIAYRGGASTLPALLASEVDMLIGGPSVFSGALSAGKVRALATTNAVRLAAFPDTPTLSELGFPSAEGTDWYGVVVRSGTPDALIQRLHAALARTLEEPAIRQKLASASFDITLLGSAEFAARLQSESTRMLRLIRETGMRSE